LHQPCKIAHVDRSKVETVRSGFRTPSCSKRFSSFPFGSKRSGSNQSYHTLTLTLLLNGMSPIDSQLIGGFLPHLLLLIVYKRWWSSAPKYVHCGIGRTER